MAVDEKKKDINEKTVENDIQNSEVGKNDDYYYDDSEYDDDILDYDSNSTVTSSDTDDTNDNEEKLIPIKIDTKVSLFVCLFDYIASLKFR